MSQPVFVDKNSMVSELGTIYVECTHTLSVDFVTGIQRVVINILSHLEDVEEVVGVRVQPVVFEQNSFYLPEQSTLSRYHGKKQFFSRLYFAGKVVPFLNFMSEFIKLSSKISFMESLFPSFMKFGRIRSAVVRFLKSCSEKIWEDTHEDVAFKKNDVLFLLDSSWHLPIFEKVQQLKSEGCLIGALFHDLFPVSYPHYCDKKTVESFNWWVEQISSLGDFYFCVSQSVSRELETYLRSNFQVPSQLYFDYFYHGSDFTRNCLAEASQCEIRDEIYELFSISDEDNLYLMVGTIEPRKNHRFVLDTFLKLWDEGSASRLCIVGKIGWKCEDIIEMITSSPHFGKKLFMLNDLNDSELQYAYSRSTALIFPSHAEGFGLPIVEALSNGLNVFASDIAVHREVGGDFCSYFSLDESFSLRDLLNSFEEDKDAFCENLESGYVPQTWKETTICLFSKMKHIIEHYENSRIQGNGKCE